MTKTKKIDGGVLTYQDNAIARDVVFETVLAWFIEHESFCGESIVQSDDMHLNSAEFLADLADDVFEFDIDWQDDEDT